jgi:hypothetical protein
MRALFLFLFLFLFLGGIAGINLNRAHRWAPSFPFSLFSVSPFFQSLLFLRSNQSATLNFDPRSLLFSPAPTYLYVTAQLALASNQRLPKVHTSSSLELDYSPPSNSLVITLLLALPCQFHHCRQPRTIIRIHLRLIFFFAHPPLVRIISSSSTVDLVRIRAWEPQSSSVSSPYLTYAASTPV